MRLSSFTQYYIRKLIRQCLKDIRYEVASRASIHRYFTTDLNIILQKPDLPPSQLAPLITEIETLVQMHHQLSLEKRPSPQHLAQTEQKIFELLGLKLRSFLPSTQIITAREDAVSQFKFFWSGQLKEGIRYDNNLYGLVLASNSKYDLKIYRLLATLSKANIPVILTVSPDRHGVWIDLQSPAYAILIEQGIELLNQVAKIHSTLCRFKEFKVQLKKEASLSEPR